MSLPNSSPRGSSQPPVAVGTPGASTAYDEALSYTAITTGTGIARLDDRLIVRVIGDDRIPFMHGMCSNDIKGLAIGAVSPALILTEHAHIIADFFVYATGDALLLEIDRTLWVKARAHLEKFLVADDVEFEELEALSVIDVEGPSAALAVATVAGDAALSIAPWRHTEADDLRIANLPRYGGPAFTLISERGHIDSIVQTIMQTTAKSSKDRDSTAGLGPIAEVGLEALEILRVEHGIALVGTDTGDKTIALEARLEPAISFSKGCYLGQETIERATARGGLKKKLYGLRIDGDRLPPVGSAIMLAAKEIGRPTSIVRSPHYGVIGLSILHHSAWHAGTRVTVTSTDGEFAAVVSELPFA